MMEKNEMTFVWLDLLLEKKLAFFWIAFSLNQKHCIYPHGEIRFTNSCCILEYN